MSLALLFSEKFRKLVKKADLFDTFHNYVVDSPMYKRKTLIGGFFSIAFIFLGAYLCLVSLSLYIFDNIL